MHLSEDGLYHVQTLAEYATLSTEQMMASFIRNTIRTLVGRSRKHNQQAAIESSFLESTTAERTGIAEVQRLIAHVDTPRVRTSALRRPKQFAFLSVHVPGEVERDSLPDLPALVFEVYPCLPKEEAFGSTISVSLKRLEHLKMLDHIAYKISVAQGVCTPMPPKLRA